MVPAINRSGPHFDVRIMPRASHRSAARAGYLRKFPRYQPITAVQFRDARKAAGLTRHDAAGLLRVSIRTVGNWETGKSRVPWAMFRLLRVYRHGDLIDPAWSGYRIIRGRLVTPENHTFAPSDLSWLSLLVRRAHALSDLLRRGAGAPTSPAPAGFVAASARASVELSAATAADPVAPPPAVGVAWSYASAGSGQCVGVLKHHFSTVGSADRLWGPTSNTGLKAPQAVPA